MPLGTCIDTIPILEIDNDLVEETAIQGTSVQTSLEMLTQQSIYFRDKLSKWHRKRFLDVILNMAIV